MVLYIHLFKKIVVLNAAVDFRARVRFPRVTREPPGRKVEGLCSEAINRTRRRSLPSWASWLMKINLKKRSVRPLSPTLLLFRQIPVVLTLPIVLPTRRLGPLRSGRASHSLFPAAGSSGVWSIYYIHASPFH